MKKLPANFSHLVIIVVIILVLIFLAKISFFNFFYYLSGPLPGSFSINFTFPKQMGQLKKENEKLLVEVASLKEIERENQILRKQLDLEERQNWHLVPASIIGRNQVMLLINKGQKHGLKPGLAVINPEGLMVGQIIDTSLITSKVLLIISSRSKIKGLTQSSRAQGIVKGEYGLGLKMEMIPQDRKISQEETVISSGLDSQIPKGLVLGRVEKVKQSDNQIFQKALLRPALSFRNLETVFIIISEANNYP